MVMMKKKIKVKLCANFTWRAGVVVSHKVNVASSIQHHVPSMQRINIVNLKRIASLLTSQKNRISQGEGSLALLTTFLQALGLPQMTNNRKPRGRQLYEGKNRSQIQGHAKNESPKKVRRILSSCAKLFQNLKIYVNTRGIKSKIN